MELSEYLRTIRKYWLMIVTCASLGTLGAGVLATLATPMYTTTAQLYVSVRAGDGSVGTELNQGGTFARQAVASYVDVAATDIVLQPAAKELGRGTTAASLVGKVSASSPANTVVINVSATDGSPTQAARIADVVSASLADVVTGRLEKPNGSGESLIAVTPIQSAAVPTAPSAPRVPLMLGLGMAVGLATGVALAVARKLLDTRIRTAAELEAISGKPLLGSVFFDASASKRPLIMHAEPRSPRAEAFRRLRTNLQFLDLGGKRRALVLTSAGPGEGKSYVASNLALALAETGASVALVDADLRRPRIAERFGIDNGAGLTDLLIGRAEIADVLQPWGTQNLAILPSGRIPPNPSEMLGSDAMAAAVEHLQSTFDHVVIDAPPTLLVTDAAVLSRTAGVLFISASGRVRRADTAEAVRGLDGVRAEVLGAVVTHAPVRGPDAAAYGEYHYVTESDAPFEAPVQRVSRRGVKR